MAVGGFVPPQWATSYSTTRLRQWLKPGPIPPAVATARRAGHERLPDRGVRPGRRPGHQRLLGRRGSFGNVFVADAGANMIKVDTAGTPSVFATFPDIPSRQAPRRSRCRRITTSNGGLPVTCVHHGRADRSPTHRGSQIWGIANDGTTSVITTGGTCVVDCELDVDGSLLISPPGRTTSRPTSAPGSGSIDRVDLVTGAITPVKGGLWLPTGIEVIDGMVYFCTFYEGSMYRFDPCPGDVAAME